MRFGLGLIATMLLCVGTQAAAPATRPSKPDPNSVDVAFEAFGFKLTAPKAWKQGVRNDHGVTFQLPGGGFIVLAGKVKDGTELKSLVEEKKKNLADTVKGLKYVKDEATTLGGQEGWQLVYDANLTAREVDPKTGKDAGGGRSVTVVNRTLQVVAVHEGVQVQLVFTSGEKVFEGQSKNAQRVIGSFVWTEAKAADAKPADDKKSKQGD